MRKVARKSQGRARVRRKVRASAQAAPVQTKAEQAIRQSQGGRSLSGRVQKDMQGHFGGNALSEVSVHHDQQAASMARQLGASAFTVNKDIYFAEGRYQPDTARGRHLLAHELTHALHHDDGTLRRQDDPNAPVSEDDMDYDQQYYDPTAPSGSEIDASSKVWPTPQNGLSGGCKFDFNTMEFECNIGPIIGGYDLSSVPEELKNLRPDFPVPDIMLPTPTDNSPPMAPPAEPDFNLMAIKCVEEYKANPEKPFGLTPCAGMMAYADPGIFTLQEQLDMPYYHPALARRYASFTIDDFISGEPGVNPAEKPAIEEGIERINRMLRLHPAASIALIGHADEVGSDAANQQLGMDRARVVEGVLRQMGVSASFSIGSQGESNPLSTAPEDGRNRRVEVKFQP